MRAILLDDEPFSLAYLAQLCLCVPGLQVVGRFETHAQALAYLAENEAELVISDIEMPGMNGLEAVRAMRAVRPGLGVIFVTGYEQYALEAFRMEAAAYLLKPCSAQELSAAVARAKKLAAPHQRVEVQTFGNFAVMVDGEPIRFANSKAKELLAVLIDRRGADVSMEQLVDLLWEERPYDEMVKRLYRKAIAYLNSLFTERGVEFFVSGRGSCHIIPAQVFCDYYQLLEGARDAASLYDGAYMVDYSWAELTNGKIRSFLQAQKVQPAL